MFAKAGMFVIFAQALLIQSAFCQVCGRSDFVAAPSVGSTYGLAGPALSSPLGYNGLSTGLLGNSLARNGLAGNSLPSANTLALEITPTTGGALPVISASAIAPNSLVIASENVYDGTLAVSGELSFVGTVGLEGVVPSSCPGAVNHACGNGVTRMISQDRDAITSGFGTGLIGGLAPGNLFGGVAFGKTTAPFGYGYGTGTASVYPNPGVVGAYPGGTIGSISGECGCSCGNLYVH